MYVPEFKEQRGKAHLLSGPAPITRKMLYIDEKGTVRLADVSFYKGMTLEQFQNNYSRRVRGVDGPSISTRRFIGPVLDKEGHRYSVEVTFRDGVLYNIDIHPLLDAGKTDRLLGMREARDLRRNISEKILEKNLGVPDRKDPNEGGVNNQYLYCSQTGYCRNGILFVTGAYYNPREGFPTGGSIIVDYSPAESQIEYFSKEASADDPQRK